MFRYKHGYKSKSIERSRDHTVKKMSYLYRESHYVSEYSQLQLVFL